MLYDAAIIGTGPAGLSAALTLKNHNKQFAWFGTKTLSTKVTKAEKISNYPGLTDVTGEELFEAFSKQIKAKNIEIIEQNVTSIMEFGDHYAIMAGPEFYEARTVLLATGVTIKALMKNEAEFMGLGVSYCATCDGGLYRGKTIAAVVNSKRFEHEVKYLSEIAAKVYYLPTYKDADEIGANVKVIYEKPAEVVGEKKVSGIVLKNGETLAVDGVFCLRDSVSLDMLMPGLATEEGRIIVDRAMATNLKGVYAAGDCTGRPYQYAKAVGEGNIAAHSIIEELAKE